MVYNVNRIIILILLNFSVLSSIHSDEADNSIRQLLFPLNHNSHELSLINISTSIPHFPGFDKSRGDIIRCDLFDVKSYSKINESLHYVINPISISWMGRFNESSEADLYKISYVTLDLPFLLTLSSVGFLTSYIFDNGILFTKSLEYLYFYPKSILNSEIRYNPFKNDVLYFQLGTNGDIFFALDDYKPEFRYAINTGFTLVFTDKKYHINSVFKVNFNINKNLIDIYEPPMFTINFSLADIFEHFNLLMSV